MTFERGSLSASRQRKEGGAAVASKRRRPRSGRGRGPFTEYDVRKIKLCGAGAVGLSQASLSPSRGHCQGGASAGFTPRKPWLG